MIKVPVDYNVVVSGTRLGLCTNVNAAMRDGFEPQGGVAVVVVDNTGGTYYYQAVVKYELQPEGQS